MTAVYKNNQDKEMAMNKINEVYENGNTKEMEGKDMQMRDMEMNAMEKNAMEKNAMEKNIMQMNTMEENTMQMNTMEENTMQMNTMEENAMQMNAMETNDMKKIENYRVLRGVVFVDDMDCFEEEVQYFAEAQAAMDIAERLYAEAFSGVIAAESDRRRAQEAALCASDPHDKLRAETDLAYLQRDCEDALWELHQAGEIWREAQEDYVQAVDLLQDAMKYAKELRPDLSGGIRLPGCYTAPTR